MATEARFHPLSRGLFFNMGNIERSIEISKCFRPLSRGLFFNNMHLSTKIGHETKKIRHKN